MKKYTLFIILLLLNFKSNSQNYKAESFTLSGNVRQSYFPMENYQTSYGLEAEFFSIKILV